MKKLTGRTKLLLLLLLTTTTVWCVNCAKQRPELRAGGLYSVDDGDGTFSVVKILVLDDSAVHIAIYVNKFPTRPTTIDPSALTFGSIDDENVEDEGIGMMHLPLSREVFERDRPVFISQTSVTAEELEGYNMWKEAGADVFR